MDSTTLADKLTKIVDEEIAGRNAELKATVNKLLKFKLCYTPPGFKDSEWYSEGDEKQPFFSEVVLYNLVGKEDARTILALMRGVWRAAGIPDLKQP